MALSVLHQSLMREITGSKYQLTMDAACEFAGMHLALASIFMLIKELINRLKTKYPKDELESVKSLVKEVKDDDGNTTHEFTEASTAVSIKCQSMISDGTVLIPTFMNKEVEKEMARRGVSYLARDHLVLLDDEATRPAVIEQIRASFDKYSKGCVNVALNLFARKYDGVSPLHWWPEMHEQIKLNISTPSLQFYKAVIGELPPDDRSMGRYCSSLLCATFLDEARKRFQAYGSVFIRGRTKLGDEILDINMGVSYRGLYAQRSNGTVLIRHDLDAVTLGTSSNNDILVMRARPEEDGTERVYNFSKYNGVLIRRLISLNMSYAQLYVMSSMMMMTIGCSVRRNKRSCWAVN